MKIAPLPNDEAARLLALQQLKILDTPPEPAFDDLTRLAAYVCGTPIAAVSFVDAHRQWFKSTVGLEASQTPREVAFCAHTILQSDLMIVADTLLDSRFANNPLVIDVPKIRFYAGAPLMTSDGYALGTLCVIDRIPRELSPEQIEGLKALSRQVMMQLELRRNLDKLVNVSTEGQDTALALRQSEERFRNLVETSSDWVWELDENFICKYTSPKVYDLLGYKPEEVLGKTPFDFMPEKEVRRVASVMAPIAASQQPYTCIESIHIHKNGNLVVFEVSGIPVFDQQGRFRGYRGMARDITQRKQAEEEIRKALEKERELGDLKSRFITTTSHEFRTPLATILLSAGLLQDYGHKWSEEKKLTHFKRIHVAVTRMTQLLEEVLLIGQTEAGKLQFNPVLMELEKFCHELVEEQQLGAGSKYEISFVNRCGIGKVYLDEKLLRHILTNLLSNAIKYSPDGGPVHLECFAEDEAVVFQIKDQGLGIPLKDQQRLFESFHRASNVGNISGTGLGLTIVKKCVDLHSGQIAIASAVGVGTTFTVTIPYNKNAENPVLSSRG